jgi:putative transposase
MSDTGKCFDNAAAESFFASLKKELVHRVVFATRTEAYDAIAEYIDFYNMRRVHSMNGYKTPIDHERLDKPVVAA